MPRPAAPSPAAGPVRLGAALASLVLLTTVLTGCTDDDPPADTPAETGGNVLAQRAQTLVANPRLTAAAEQAGADGDTTRAAVLERLADVPTGVWLTPERYPAGQVGPYVTSVVSAAAETTVPVFVVYGIPDRDCTGEFSAGGLTTDTYLPWVQEIATAVGPAGVVVLEPDALPATTGCDGVRDRIRLLRQAVAALAAAEVTTYVDAGHSDWVPARRMAALLEQVDVGSVRGFTTNVANYQPLARERTFAEELSSLLGGAHYVIDTSRNGDPSGAGDPVSDWCNPPGRALGDQPGFVDDGTALDALLWVKPPAESDGPCHGGPPAGEVWIQRAVSLATAAGW